MLRTGWLWAIALLPGAMGYGQTRLAGIQERFENLDFAGGAIGIMPPGWRLGPEGTSDYAAGIVAGASCAGGGRCANVLSIGRGSLDLAFLYQVVDAKPYRGKWLEYRAAVRAEVAGTNAAGTNAAGTNAARLLLRIHRDDGATSFRDDMGDHPIVSGAWDIYEIDAPIPSDARDIEFGMQLVGRGAAWIDQISLTFEESPYPPEKNAIRTLVRQFAEARNAHDGEAVAALYSEGGEWLVGPGYVVHGHQALAKLWGGVTGQVTRTIESVEFPGNSVAVVRVTADYGKPIGIHHEVMIAVKESAGWRIRVHQTTD